MAKIRPRQSLANDYTKVKNHEPPGALYQCNLTALACELSVTLPDVSISNRILEYVSVTPQMH